MDKRKMIIETSVDGKTWARQGISVNGGFKKRYAIETSNDHGSSWTLRGGFIEGEPSRFGDLMSPEVAIKEAESYKDHFKKGKPDSWKVRLIIEI